jgi:Secretion system C-terminal sorting domain/Metalloenzyme superfamily
MRSFFILLTLISWAMVTFAQSPENVIIVSIDGIRNDEAFEAESLYLRHIWNDLRPLGTIYTRFWNLGYTVTTAGHTTIFSGVYQYLPNNSGMAASVRIKEPCLSEYYRKYFGFPEATTGCVVGKVGNLWQMNSGLDPSYGEPYQGFMVQGGADTVTARLMDSVMTFNHPRLVLCNLPSVDGQGHTGVESLYTNAIIGADSIVYEVYKRIQALPPYTDTFYKNKTVLIVTTDHGRHDDAHGGFQAHGDWDHGCKHIPFLAIGPGIRQNTVITTYRNHIDIAPTVGYILGFPTPLAEGNVMTEMLLPTFHPQKPRIGQAALPLSHEWNLSNTSSFSRDPDIAIDNMGRLHVVWSDKSQNYWKIFYRQSTDYGLTWQAVKTLFAFPPDTLMWTAKIAAKDSIIVSAIGIARVPCEIDTITHALDSSFVWRVWTAVSINGGNTFTNHCVGYLDSTMMTLPSPAAVGNNRFSLVYSSFGGGTYPQNGLLFNFRNYGGSWRDSAIHIAGGNQGTLTICDNSSAFHIAGYAKRTGDWDLYCWKSTDGLTWTRRWIIDDSITGSYYYDYDPHLIATDTNNLFLVWARKPDSAGIWQIYFTYSNDNGTSWANGTPITSSPVGAWNPKILARRDTLFVFWEDHRDGEPKIYYRYSSDLGTTWSTEEPIAGLIARNPTVTIDSNRIYLAWQDYRDGNWEIYFKYLPSSLPKHDVGPIRLVTPQPRSLPDDSMKPQAMIRNYGDVFETFKTYLIIEPTYFDSVSVTIAPEDSLLVNFSQIWNATFGTYNFKLYTLLGSDNNQMNDTVVGTIQVIGDSWVQLNDMPLGSRNKRVKSGGCLTYVSDLDLIYALKGNNTNDFFAYDLNGSHDWVTKESVLYDLNGKKKRVKSGAALCYDGTRYIYMLKGNNTTEFWRYDTKADSFDTIWQILPPVPELPSGKKLKGGTGIAFVTEGVDDYLYLLKGSKTTDFYVYHIEDNSWLTTLPSAPLGPNQKPFKAGSGMVKINNGLYALKANENELYYYDLTADTWQTNPISILPLYGRSGKKKKVKDGASICYDGIDHIFAFKGGNTQEFWQYSISEDTWIQNADLPLGPNHRKVKSGGALTIAQGKIFGLKGNNTREFWSYIPGPTTSFLTHREQLNITASSKWVINIPGIIIVPNPSPGLLKIRCSSVDFNNANFRIFDSSGRLRKIFKATAKSSTYELLLNDLIPGVYFLQIETKNKCYNYKFVIRK